MFKKVSIKMKLLVLSVVILILLSFGISYVAIEKSSQALLESKFKQLSTVEVAKHAELKNYFNSLKHLISTLAMDETTLHSIKSFKKGFENIYMELPLDTSDIKEKMKLDYEVNYLNMVDYHVPNSAQKKQTDKYLPNNLNGVIAQYVFITDNKAPVGQKDTFIYDKKYDSSYMKAHQKYHQFYDKYLHAFELYDIFLIDTEGNIVYTVFKEKDFATNLNIDIYQETGLARVYKKAMQSNSKENILFEDYTPYEPSYNTPASFVALPIFDKKKKVGVLAFQMPVDHINNIMQFNQKYERAGLGKTGECYLVGSDYLMRSNSRFQKDIKDENVQKLNTTIGLFKVKTKSVEAVMDGDRTIGKHTIEGYMGKEVLSIYHTVDVFDTVKWAIVAEITKDEAIEPAYALKKYIIVVMGILLIVSIVITLIFLKSAIFKPLDLFQNGLIEFFEFLKTGKGELKEIHVTKNDDEIGKMSNSINEGILEVKASLFKKEEEQWIKDGVNQLNAILLNIDDIEQTTNEGLKYILEYVKADVGVVYLFDKKVEKLRQYSFYSYSQTQNVKKVYELGDGIVGQVALQKKPIFLKDEVKDNTDMVINSATMSTKPKSTYTYPLEYHNELLGVIELGSLNVLDENNIEFLNIVMEAFSTSISTALKSHEVDKLLRRTEKNNHRLKTQQQKLEEANTAMEEQQQQLEVANTNLEEQQQQLEEANALMEEQQQQLELQNHDLQKAKEEVMKKAEDLELSSKYKSEFLANMSHELRTPLNAIILLSQLLTKNKQNNLQEDDIKKAKTIYTSGNELLRLINDILDLSKVEAGKIEIIIDEFLPSQFLENIKNLYIFNAEEKNLEFNVVDNYNDIISSDEDRISQIVKNLVSNALKFTSQGNITVEINKIDDKERPIQIVVSDTGIGIPFEKQQLIFEAFTQADGSTSREYGGTGLGLSITKELVNLLGGQITLESTQNKGSKFIIHLPNLKAEDIKKVAVTPKIQPPVQIKPTEVLTQATSTTSSVIPKDDRDIVGSNYALLVVDDDITFCDIVYDSVKRNDHFGLIATTGNDALAMVEEYNISGIMLDLTLPDMDGVDILKKVKSDKRYQDVPVYIISSKDKDESLIQMGAKGFEQKPLLEDDIEKIISNIDKFIKEHKKVDEKPKEERIILDDVDLKGVNVLVVDDNIKNIFVLDTLLSDANAKVFTAYNGKEALELLEANNEIKIILMDIMMPVMDGYEAITAIRGDEKLKHIPIIAVTAKAMKEDRDKCISVGADDFVSKPIDMDALLSLVKVWSEKKHK